MKAIIDTNAFVSGIIWSGKPAQIVSKWLSGEFELILSAELLAEYVEVIERLSKNPELASHWQDKLIKKATFVSVTHTVDICRDPDDNFILALTLASGADYLITGDKDILTISDFPIRIVSPATFLLEISSRH
jgi:putative PIN family toxin of toxin-antitoxin system